MSSKKSGNFKNTSFHFTSQQLTTHLNFSTMIIIKITYGNKTRRIAIDDILSFKVLKKLCLDMFKDLTEDQLHLTYIDSECDIISICSDMELQEAVRQLEHSDPKVLRLFIGYGEQNYHDAFKSGMNNIDFNNSHFLTLI